MRKRKILVSSLVALSFLVGSLVLAVEPPTNSGPPADKGNPWDAIYELQNKVVVLEDKVVALWDKVKTLQDEIVALATRVSDLETWKATIETWKITVENNLADLDKKITDEVTRLDGKIDDAVTGLEEKVNDIWTKLETVQAEITELTGRVLALESWKATIETWKTEIDSWKVTIGDKIDVIQSELAALDAKFTAEVARLDERIDGVISLWTDANGYIYPNNIGTSFQITDTGNLYVPGNVGIGTASPFTKLYVSEELVSNNVVTDVMTIERMTSSGLNGADGIGAGITFRVESDDGTNFETARMRTLYTDANLGTGLDSAITFFTRKAGTIAERMRINGGNVGIGTTSPGQKLTVAGTIESTSGGFKFPDGTVQTSASTRNFGYSRGSGTKIFNTMSFVWENADSYLSPITITTHGRPIRITFHANVRPNPELIIRGTIDGAALDPYINYPYLAWVHGASMHGQDLTLSFDVVLVGVPAGQHTFRLEHGGKGRGSDPYAGEVGYLYYDTSLLWIEELP